MFRTSSLILVIVLFPLIVTAQQFQNSRFKKYSLEYGISIKIPIHWQIIEKRLMDQIDTVTEALTGIPQGNNVILIAANYYGKNIKNPSATARLSIRYKKTIDQNQLVSMSNDEIQYESLMGRASLEKGLKNIDSSMLVTEYKMSRKKLNSFSCLETVYSINHDDMHILYIIPFGDRRVKFHLFYKLSEAQYLRPTI